MAIDVLGCLIFLAIVALVGYATTLAIIGNARRSIVEITGLTLMLGAGLTGTLLVLLSIIDIPTARWVVLLVGAAAIITIVILWRGKMAAAPALPKFDRSNGPAILILIIPILLLVGMNLAGAVPAISFDYFEWDSAVIWGFKAKVLHEQALLWHSPGYFYDLRLSYSHLDYPLLWPALIAGVYGVIGHPSEQLGKVILPLIVAGESLLAYSGARLWLGRFASLMLAVMLVGTPSAIVHATHGSADVPLMAFYLGAVIYLARWMMHHQRRDIILAALFSGFAASTKTEGIPLAAIHLAMVTLLVLVSRQSRDWKDLAVFAAIVIAFVGFWSVWRAGLPHTHDDYASRLRWSIISENIGRIGIILRTWIGAIFEFHGFLFLWLALPIMAILGFRAFSSREAIVLWILLGLHLALYLLVYVITDWDVKELLSVTAKRVLLHVTPVVMLLLAVHWNAAGDVLRESE